MAGTIMPFNIYFQMWVWSDDGQTQLLTPTPVTRLFRVYRNMALNSPFEYEVTAFLSDAVAGTIGRGNYVELYAGRTKTRGVYPPSDQDLWLSGYVEQITKNITRDNQYLIVLHSALLELAHRRDLGALIMEYPQYKDAVQALTGLNAAGVAAKPGQFGILTGSGWEHNVSWKAPDSPIISVQVTGQGNPGDNALVLNDTSKLRDNMTLRTNNGTGEHVRIYKVVSNTVVQLWTNLQQVHNVGETVTSTGIIIPGQGDSWRTDWASQLLNLDTMATTYGFHYREEPGSKAKSGKLTLGPMGDPSPLTDIWGGDEVAKHLGPPFTDKNGNVIRPATAAHAQEAGMAVIESAQYTQDTSSIINVYWPTGSGNGDTLVTIEGFDGFQGPPLDKNGNPQYGWQAWTYGTDTFYVWAGNKQNWHGDTYEIIAHQQQDAHWAYGVCDRSSILGDQWNKAYGFREVHKQWAKIKDPNLLLSQALGALYTNSKPVDEWIFHVRQPLTSTKGVPSYPRPGNTINVHYRGVTHLAPDIDTTPGSPTYGQLVPGSDYTYLSYPNVSDPDILAKVEKVTQFEDEWTNKSYIQTITMGKFKRTHHRFLEDLAQDFEKHTHRDDRKHSFTFCRLDGISFYKSKNPGVQENKAQNRMEFTPGGLIVSNTPHSEFFGDNRSVEYVVTLSDSNQVFNFWFAKTYDGTVVNPVPSNPYGVFRLCMTGANPGVDASDGKRLPGCGFLWIDTAGHGHRTSGLLNKKLFDKNGCLPPGTYRVKVGWSHGIYEAWIQKVKNGTNVWSQDLVAVWHDDGAQLTPGGAIGWHCVGGTQNAYLFDLAMHPHHKKSNASHGGKNGRHQTVVRKSQGGVEVVEHDAVNATFLTAHRLHADGTLHNRGKHVHGHDVNSNAFQATISTITTGSVTTVTFTQSLNGANELKSGWLVQDTLGNWGTVLNPTYDNNGNVNGFQSTDPAGSGTGNMLPGASVFWDPLEIEGAPQWGHHKFGVFNPPRFPKDPRAGWATVLRPADAPNDGSSDFIFYPDGSHSKGDKPLTQRNGAIINVANEIIGGGNFAKGIEQEGKMLFDAGEYDSATQTVELYQANGTKTTITPQSNLFVPTNVGNDLFSGGWSGSITSPATWLAATMATSIKGESDAILALTPGTYSSTTYNTVRWYDNVIVEPDGTARVNTVRHNVSMEIPLQMGVAQGSSNLILGSDATLVGYSSNGGIGGRAEVYLDMDGGTLAQIKANDTFVIDQGLSTQESFTVYAVDTANNGLVLTSPLAKTHATGQNPNGAIILQKTANGGTVTVHSALPSDGTFSLDDIAAAIDVVALGFLDDKGNWYRGYWGDPEWGVKAAFTSAVIPCLGPLHASSTQFTRVYAKASQFLNKLGQPLYGDSIPRVNVVGVEVVAYSANPGSGQSVYFDAHRHGHGPKKGQIAPGSVTATGIGSGAVTGVHKDPPSHADAHAHSDLNYWLSPDNMLHWESGTLVDHKGTKYTINAGSNASGAHNEDNPNPGVSALIGAQTSAAGNYLVFNSTAAAIQIFDPGTGGVVTIPPYSASGGTDGQATGFGALSDQFDWSKRPGGGAIKNGPPKGMFKIGKLAYKVDAYTGELPVQNHGGHGKRGGGGARAGSSGRKHDTQQKPHRLHFTGGILGRMSGGSTPVFNYEPQATGGSLYVAVDNGTPLKIFTSSSAGTGTQRIPMIGAGSGVSWASGAYAHQFCGLTVVPYPGSISVTNASGGSLPTSSMQIALCWLVSQGGQTVESMLGLSSAVAVGGANAYAVTTPVPPKKLGSTITGFRLYASVDGGITWQQGQVTNYNFPAGAAGMATLVSLAAAAPTFGFSAWASGTNFDADNMAWMHKLGFISPGTDPVTANYVFHSYHIGSHENHGQQHQDKSHTRVHDHPHKPSRHGHHGTSVEVVGGIAYVNYATPGGSTFSSTLQVDDGATSYTILPGAFAVGPGDYVYVDTTNVANGGSVAPQVRSSWNEQHHGWIQIARISSDTDADGNRSTEGHHHGAHKIHEKHIHNGAVKGGVSGTRDHITHGHVARRHTANHHPGNHHYQEIGMWVTNSVSGNPGTCTVNWTSGSIIDHTGNSIVSIAPGSITASAGQWIVWNGSSMGTMTAQDITGNAYDSYIPMAYVGITTDLGTAQYTLTGFHSGVHAIHSRHIQNSAVVQNHHVFTPTFTIPPTNFTVPGSGVIGVGSNVWNANYSIPLPWKAMHSHGQVVLAIGTNADSVGQPAPVKIWNQPVAGQPTGSVDQQYVIKSAGSDASVIITGVTINPPVLQSSWSPGQINNASDTGACTATVKFAFSVVSSSITRILFYGNIYSAVS